MTQQTDSNGDRALAYFDARPDRFTRVNITDKVAGYRLKNGKPLALIRRNQMLTLFVVPGDWLTAIEGQILNQEFYPAERSRNSNLGSCAPELASGNVALCITLRTPDALDAVCSAYGTEWPADTDVQPQTQGTSIVSHLPLNQILYGPPGTGKTYATIEAALEILDPVYLQANRHDRSALTTRFKALDEEGRVRFVTFHQSFSYEDFVEGLRADSDESTGQVCYEVMDGVFKHLCERAEAGVLDTDDPFEKAFERMQEKLEAAGGRLTMQTVRKKLAFEIEYIGGESFRVFPEGSQDQKVPYRANVKDLRRLYQSGSKSNMHNSSYVHGILDFLHRECDLPVYQQRKGSDGAKQNYVLIIDEINRGNVSRIFGELITLIESSKRAGEKEALSAVLPYSKENFSVPSNLYLIGTMNTADRSLAGLDIALRRRFEFRELPPRPELLDDVVVEGINIGRLLRVMNERIEVLLDRDHCLGHAYFMPLKTRANLKVLEVIFRNQVLPLLQEYFFEDWQHIQWVLNDHRKPGGDRFVFQRDRSIRALFGADVDISVQNLPWSINDDAFQRVSAYSGIVQAPEEKAVYAGLSEDEIA